MSFKCPFFSSKWWCWSRWGATWKIYSCENVYKLIDIQIDMKREKLLKRKEKTSQQKRVEAVVRVNLSCCGKRKFLECQETRWNFWRRWEERRGSALLSTLSQSVSQLHYCTHYHPVTLSISLGFFLIWISTVEMSGKGSGRRRTRKSFLLRFLFIAIILISTVSPSHRSNERKRERREATFKTFGCFFLSLLIPPFSTTRLYTTCSQLNQLVLLQRNNTFSL